MVSVWVEIKRKSQVFRSRGWRRESELTSSDNLNYSIGGPRTRSASEHTEETAEKFCSHAEAVEHAESKPAEEHDDAAETLVLRDSGDFDEDSYATIDVDDREENRLFMTFEIRQTGRGLDRNYMKESILSHRKVKEFLLNEGNDFDVKIYDWEYQKESHYSYIPSNGK